MEQHLLALPPRFGGLGIINAAKSSSFQFLSLVSITAPLVELILQQFSTYFDEVLMFRLLLNNRLSILIINQTAWYDALLTSLPPKLQSSILLSSEKGSSSWLTKASVWLAAS